MTRTWITWEREGERLAVELPAEVVTAIERYAAEIGTNAAEVVASIARSFAAEVRLPDGETLAAQLRGLLTQGSVMLTLRPQAAGVDLPEALRASAVVTLRIGYSLSPPIPDLEVDADGVRATLIFGGQPYRCVVSWRAVLVAALESGGPAPAPPARERPKLRLV